MVAAALKSCIGVWHHDRIARGETRNPVDIAIHRDHSTDSVGGSYDDKLRSKMGTLRVSEKSWISIW